MKVETIWTDNELMNVRYALRQKYGKLEDGTLIKYATRDIVEQSRVARQNSPASPVQQLKEAIALLNRWLYDDVPDPYLKSDTYHIICNNATASV